MLLLNLTLPTPAENLALDEAILDTAEASETHAEVLRIWESPTTFVVLGRSSPFDVEVNHDYCTENNIPVLRRCSGGATVLAGPGCLMYAVLLDYQKRPELRMLDVAHRFVMSKMKKAVQSLNVDVSMEGTCDLVFNQRKVSGNALRCKRNFMVYHGTFLTGLSIEKISNCLKAPVRQPDYREQRTHDEFLGQLPVSSEQLRDAVIQEWAATETVSSWPRAMTTDLAETKYLDSSWTRTR